MTAYHFRLGQGIAHVTGIPLLEWISWPGQRIAVPFFFVISGFSVHYAERAKISDWPNQIGLLRGYLRRRVWRIYPPYLAALVLALVIGVVGGRRTTAEDLAVHLSLTYNFFPQYFNTINVVFWSIAVEMWLYALYPVAQWLHQKYGMAAAGMAVFATSAICILLTTFVCPGRGPVALWFVPNVFFGWCVGAAIAEGLVTDRLFYRTALWWSVGIAWLAIHLLLHISGSFDGGLWAFVIPSLIVLCAWPLSALVILEQQTSNTNVERGVAMRLLLWLGLLSYSLYLVHQPLIDLRDTILNLLTPGLARRVAFALWFGVPFAVAWLSWKFVELPSMRAGRRAGTPSLSFKR